MSMKKYIAALLAVTSIATSLIAPMTADAAEVQNVTYIAKNSAWTYNDTNTDLYTNPFYAVDYDTTTWKTGTAPLGYPAGESNSVFGTVENGTVVANQSKPNAFITYYFKNEFQVEEADLVRTLSAQVGIDDGFVIYINGTEVNRTYMDAGSVTHSTASNYINEASSAEGLVTVDLSSFTNLLVDGTNEIAVSVHNRDNNSSDIFFDMELTATVEEAPSVVIEGAVDAKLTGTELVVTQNGEKVECFVNMNNAINVNTFRAQISYDPEVLTLETAESVYENALIESVEEANGVIDILTGLADVQTVTEDTPVAHCVFTVKEGVLVNETILKLESFECASVVDGEGLNNQVNNIENTLEVVLYTYEYGSDLNQDGTVTLADLSVALTNYQTAAVQGDVNRDGIVDVLDFVIIAGFIQ